PRPAPPTRPGPHPTLTRRSAPPPSRAAAAPRPAAAAWATPSALRTPRPAPRPPTSRGEVLHRVQPRLPLEALLTGGAAEVERVRATSRPVQRGRDVHRH